MKDALLIKTKALPAANATNQSDTFDVGDMAGKGLANDLFEFEVSVPALPANTDNTKTILITLQESADDSTYADVDPLTQIKIAGVTTTGSAARTVRVPVAGGGKRYLQFNQTVPTGAGDNTAKSITYALKPRL